MDILFEYKLIFTKSSFIPKQFNKFLNDFSVPLDLKIAKAFE
jgi:hypothetical protein